MFPDSDARYIVSGSVFWPDGPKYRSRTPNFSDGYSALKKLPFPAEENASLISTSMSAFRRIRFLSDHPDRVARSETCHSWSSSDAIPVQFSRLFPPNTQRFNKRAPEEHTMGGNTPI